MNPNIGFMQGRLSPLRDGRIQSFPWDSWQAEVSLATQNDITLMEWTLDQENLYENPLLTAVGQKAIRDLCDKNSMRIESLTGDCFMQSPFWKAEKVEAVKLQRDFMAICEACSKVGITYIVVPLVDNGRISSVEQEDALVNYLESIADKLIELQLKIVFESDFEPVELGRLIARLDAGLFGINYDIGNSAALGFDPQAEFAAYGERVLNIHIKDRLLGGTTVPLGIGSADFPTVFQELAKLNYRGNYILQTARAVDEDHIGPLLRYRDMTIQWLEQAAATQTGVQE